MPPAAAFAAPAALAARLSTSRGAPHHPSARPPVRPTVPHRTRATATPAPAAPQPSPPPSPRAPAASVSIRHYDGSTLLLTHTAPSEPRAARVIIDPWLTGPLVFGGVPAFFRAEKPLTAGRAPADYGPFDAVVLSQDLPDHCHRPTLARLPRDTPVVCPRKAVPVLEELGYERIFPLEPGMRTPPFAPGSPLDGFAVRAGPGSVTGPPWSAPQLAFCFEFGGGRRGDGTRPLRVYMETHGVHDAAFVRELGKEGRLDAVISPAVTTTIPALAGYKVVNGVPEMVELCRVARPRVAVPFDNSRTPATGVLSRLTKQFGGIEEFRERVKGVKALEEMQVVEPLVDREVVIAGHGVCAPVGASPGGAA